MKKTDRKIKFLIQHAYEGRMDKFWILALLSVSLYVIAVVLLIALMSYNVATNRMNFYESTIVVLSLVFFFGSAMAVWLGDIYVSIESRYDRIRKGLAWKKNYFGEYVE